jgi:erythromycin esterase
MYYKIILTGLLLSLFSYSCSDHPEELNLDPEIEALVNILKDEMQALAKDPYAWSDEDLGFLDQVAGKSVIALGESTHGTAEFFDAKHRIFRYLVENHGYKVFAFEADFGESLFINEAIQKGEQAEIDDLMRSKMHFWTWKTQEVKELLEWMCHYNQGKPEEEKVHYMGMDCQFNTYHPDMIMEYLDGKGLPFELSADSLLGKAKMDTENNFLGYSSESFDAFLQKLDALQDSLTSHKDALVAASSEKAFQLHSRILKVVRQVSEVKYFSQTQQYSINYRDKYMAENTVWLKDYFEGEKIVVWAHNGHIANMEYGNTGMMGNYLNYALGDEYATIGFLFSQGTFTAVGMEGSQYTGLETQTLDTLPRENSLNAIMSNTQEPAFSIELIRLQAYVNWFVAFNKEMEYFQMGAVYNNVPGDYYSTFDPFLFDYLIYFDRSTASVPLD